MDPLTIAASGMRSAELRLGASAHNVANLNTPDFRPLRAHQSSRAGGGSQVRVVQEARPQAVDLAREIVEQMLAKLQHGASLRVLVTASETRGSLVDLLA
jgi:flagellar hook protein FlgE